MDRTLRGEKIWVDPRDPRGSCYSFVLGDRLTGFNEFGSRGTQEGFYVSLEVDISHNGAHLFQFAKTATVHQDAARIGIRLSMERSDKRHHILWVESAGIVAIARANTLCDAFYGRIPELHTDESWLPDRLPWNDWKREEDYRQRLQALFRTQADKRITEYRYLSAYFGHGTCLKSQCKGYVSGQTYSDDWPVSRIFSTAPEDQILWQAKMDILIQGRLLKDANMDQVLERLGKTKQQLLGEQSAAVNAYPSRDVRLEIPVNVEKWWYCTQCTARLDRINLMLKHETNVHGKPTAD